MFGNVAEIIIKESEEGAVKHHTWRTVFILEDLLCSGAIVLPVIWLSIVKTHYFMIQESQWSSAKL